MSQNIWDSDLEKHIFVLYALLVDFSMYTCCVFFITKSWYKIFSGPYITDMSLYLYPTASD